MVLNTYCRVAIFVFYIVPWWYTDKMFNRLSSKKVCGGFFMMFANFRGVNSPTRSRFKLRTSMRIWKEMLGSTPLYNVSIKQVN